MREIIKLLRPHQYIKNGFIFVPLFFGYKIYDTQALEKTVLGFLLFCMVSSAVYILNDLCDREYDKKHPKKKNRPLAAGTVSIPKAVTLMIVLGLTAVSCSLILGLPFFSFILAYLSLNIGYSLKLKHTSILDILCVSSGFVIRVFAGGFTAGLTPSHWLVIMTFLLALFLSLAKRRDDLVIAASSGPKTRKSLDGYTTEFVDVSMIIMAAVAVVSYILYTLSPENMVKHSSQYLYLTSVWVIAGFLRYLQITFVEENSGSPTLVVLKDTFLKVILGLWLLSFFIIFYVLGS